MSAGPLAHLAPVRLGPASLLGCRIRRCHFLRVEDGARTGDRILHAILVTRHSIPAAGDGNIYKRDIPTVRVLGGYVDDGVVHLLVRLCERDLVEELLRLAAVLLVVGLGNHCVYPMSEWV